MSRSIAAAVPAPLLVATIQWRSVGPLLVAVATGITATLLAVPAMRSVLIVISAAYILWLVYNTALAAALVGATAFAALR